MSSMPSSQVGTNSTVVVAGISHVSSRKKELSNISSKFSEVEQVRSRDLYINKENVLV